MIVEIPQDEVLYRWARPTVALFAQPPILGLFPSHLLHASRIAKVGQMVFPGLTDSLGDTALKPNSRCLQIGPRSPGCLPKKGGATEGLAVWDVSEPLEKHIIRRLAGRCSIG
jgi:hypothetical protein